MATEYELRLIDIVLKLEKLMNGADNETVQTTNGQVPTIAGIIKQAKQFKHVLPVIDYKLYSDLQSDALANLLIPGQLYRVWGDTSPIHNGFFRVDEVDATLTIKTDYSDIYDLRQNLPNPWNYIDTTIYGSQILTSKVCSWTISKTSVDSFAQSLEGTIHMTDTTPAQEKLTQTTFKLMFAYNETFLNRVKQSYNIVFSNTLQIGATVGTTPTIKIWVTIEDSVIADLATISLNIQQIGNIDLTNYRFDVILKNHKKTSFLLG